MEMVDEGFGRTVHGIKPRSVRPLGLQNELQILLRLRAVSLIVKPPGCVKEYERTVCAGVDDLALIVRGIAGRCRIVSRGRIFQVGEDKGRDGMRRFEVMSFIRYLK